MPLHRNAVRPAPALPPLLLALALGAAGCSAGNAPTLSLEGDSTLAYSEYPPTGYQARLDFAPPSQGDVTGYVLERRRLPDGPWEPALSPVPGPGGSIGPGWLLFPGQFPGLLWYRFPPDATEGSDHALRLRALPDPDGRRASTPVTVHLALRSPQLEALGRDRGPGLSIVNRSSVATSIELSRTGATCDGEAGATTTHVLPVDAHEWLDPDPGAFRDGYTASYRARATHGQLASPPYWKEVGSPPLPPVVSASRSGDAVTVAVQGTSRCPVSYGLYAWRPTVDALRSNEAIWLGFGKTSSPPAAPTRVAVPAPADPTLYWVADWPPPSGPDGPFLEQPGALVVEPPDDRAFLAEVDGGPDPRQVDWTPSGEARLETDGSGLSALRVAAPGGAVACPLAGASSSDLGRGGALTIDAAGRPHALYPVAGALRHVWFDGLACLEDELPGQPGYVSVAAGPAGGLAVAWREAQRVVLARWDDLGWALLPPDGAPASWSALALDAAGAAHLLGRDPVDFSGRLWSETAAGWVSEPAPVANPDVADLLAVGDRLVAAFKAAPGQVMLVERDATGWGAPRRLGDASDGAFPGSSGLLWLRRSADGARLACLDRGHGVAWIVDGAGTATWRWHDARWLRGAGFDADGRLRLRTSDAYARWAVPGITFSEP